MTNKIPTTKAARMKRPASHKWAIFVYVCFIAVNALLMVMVYHGPLAMLLNDPLTPVLMLLCAVQLAGVIFSPRAVRHYWIGVAALAVIAVRGLYYAVLAPWYELLAHGAGGHLLALVPLACNTCGIALFFWLVWAYTFGKASCEYYGLPRGTG